MTKYLIYFSDPCSSVDRWDKALHVTLYDYMTMPEHKNPCPKGVIELIILVNPFFGHDDYIISSSDLCLGVEKCNFTIWLICPRPGTTTCALGSWNLQYFVRPYLGNHYYKLCLVEKKTIFERNNAYSLWLSCPRPSTRNAALGIMKFTIFVDPYLVFTTIHHYYALRLSEPFLV